ncbi:MAG: alpha/beta hydrolase [Bacteroidales bacterium]|nr:alpha/beta hydrolase [Bacteroidales bacterium]
MFSLLLFDWPSKNSDFNMSLARVRYCTDNFYNLLLKIKKYRSEFLNENQHFSLLCHSLGNYFLTHLVVNGNNQYLKEKFIDNIIMNAPAVRSKKNAEVISQLAFQERIYITFNKRDFVLKGAGFITTSRMLGNRILEPLASNASYFDFSPVAEREHTYLPDITSLNMMYHLCSISIIQLFMVNMWMLIMKCFNLKKRTAFL